MPPLFQIYTIGQKCMLPNLNICYSQFPLDIFWFSIQSKIEIVICTYKIFREIRIRFQKCVGPIVDYFILWVGTPRLSLCIIFWENVDRRHLDLEDFLKRHTKFRFGLYGGNWEQQFVGVIYLEIVGLYYTMQCDTKTYHYLSVWKLEKQIRKK